MCSCNRYNISILKSSIPWLVTMRFVLPTLQPSASLNLGKPETTKTQTMKWIKTEHILIEEMKCWSPHLWEEENKVVGKTALFFSRYPTSPWGGQFFVCRDVLHILRHLPSAPPGLINARGQLLPLPQDQKQPHISKWLRRGCDAILVKHHLGKRTRRGKMFREIFQKKEKGGYQGTSAVT